MLLLDTSEGAARSALSSAVSLGVAVCGRSLASGLGPVARVLKQKKKLGRGELKVRSGNTWWKGSDHYSIFSIATPPLGERAVSRSQSVRVCESSL